MIMAFLIEEPQEVVEAEKLLLLLLGPTSRFYRKTKSIALKGFCRCKLRRNFGRWMAKALKKRSVN